VTAEGAGRPHGRQPAGRLPHVGTPELVAALHHRREGRRQALRELRAALERLGDAVEARGIRIAGLLDALDARVRDGA
jgi:hypothetical protein